MIPVGGLAVVDAISGQSDFIQKATVEIPKHGQRLPIILMHLDSFIDSGKNECTGVHAGFPAGRTDAEHQKRSFLMKLYGESGTAYETSAEPFKKGGEGSLYTVVGRPDIVIKVYHDPLRPGLYQKIKKLKELATGWDADFRAVTAPPLEVLYSSPTRTPQSFMGFTMRKVQGAFKSLGEIYDQKHSAYLSYANKIRACLNICSLTYCAHQNGVVIGDYNQKNIGVAPDGRMTLFDNDSFQIGDSALRCIVGVHEEMAPEVLLELKKNKADLITIGKRVYNPNTDRYTMALHIFHLLMAGAHPFNHRIDAGQLSSSKTVSSVTIGTVEAAQRKLFVYANPSVFRKPPKHFPSYQILPEELRSCFERAFIDGLDEPDKRPSPKEFYEVLKTYLQCLTPSKCGIARHHLYQGYNGPCEWCRLEKIYQVDINA